MIFFKISGCIIALAIIVKIIQILISRSYDSNNSNHSCNYRGVDIKSQPDFMQQARAEKTEKNRQAEERKLLRASGLKSHEIANAIARREQNKKRLNSKTWTHYNK